MAIQKITGDVIATSAVTADSLADTTITAAKLHTTLDLTGKTVTVATASAGDNDTTVASTAFVSTAVSNLVDSSPDALNTLNELAAALGDDANFSTTVTNSIALKAPLASPAFTGTATMDGLTVDGDASISSANARLRLFETDTTDLNTQFQNQAGDFFIKTIPDDASSSTTRFGIDHSTGDISFYEDTGTTAKFFWDASAESLGIGIAPYATRKLTVFGTGVGEATVLIEGEGGADPCINFLANNTQHWTLGIDDSDSDKFKLSEHSALGTNDYLVVDTSGNVGIGTTDPSALLHLKSTVNAAGPSLIFENTNNAQSMNIDYWNNAGAVQSRIQYAEGPASWNFIPNVSTGASALHIAYNGNVGIGTTSDTSRLKVYNSTVAGNTQLHIHNDKHGDAAVLRLEGKRTSLNDTAQLLFANNGSTVAKIDVLSAGDDGNIRFHTSASGTGSSIVAVASIDADGSMTARSFIPNSGYNIEYLIVGGGAGGGTTVYDDAGGGGAGGYRSSIVGNPSANYAPPEPPLLAVVGKTYAVTVGAGGNQLGSGNNSSFGTIVSEGGGRAGNHRNRGHPGGSGGGGSGYYTAGDNVEGGVGYYGQGNNGGTVTNYSAAGGGGGAGAPGEGGSGSSKAGGAGVWSVVESGINLHIGSQTGNRVYRAGGGGAYGGGAGGLGGGGRGWSTSQTPTAGAVNTGGGGGGNKENHANSATVGGGSGIVILKVPTSNYTGTTTGSPTVTTVGSYKIIKFTSSGSYTA